MKLIVRKIVVKPVALIHEAIARLIEHQRRFRDDQLPLLDSWSALADLSTAATTTATRQQQQQQQLLHLNHSTSVLRAPKAVWHRAPGRRYYKKPNHHIA